MTSSRKVGVTIPLFSLRTRSSWGIGEIPDLPACAAWIKTAGMTLLQILPPHELARGEASPYGARTAFGLDPIFMGIDTMEDLDANAIADALGFAGRAELESLRGAPHVVYERVRGLKSKVIHRAFERFVENEWSKNTPRAEALRAFIASEAAWEDDLALYVALRESHEGYGWGTWPDGERLRHPDTLRAARETHAEKILEHQYTQWILGLQWEKARAEMRTLGVELMGDLPFIVCGESADAWARPDQFRTDASLGAPPDGFAPDGQDWGLPIYDWEAMERDDLAWVRARTRRSAQLYDRFRLDHVVGYFRMFVLKKPEARAPGEKGKFLPKDEPSQLKRGQRVLGTIAYEARETRVIAEDLGVVPPFVRDTMRGLGVPGYKIIPWEKNWDGDRQFQNPQTYPELSVASWSTHDTAPINSWWPEFSAGDRAELEALMHLGADASDDERWRGLMKLLMSARSSLALVLAPEILGEAERINTPGTVDEKNWTYRLPMAIEDLLDDPHAKYRMQTLRELATASGR